MKPNIPYKVTKDSTDRTFAVGDRVRLEPDGAILALADGHAGFIPADQVASATAGWAIEVDAGRVARKIEKLRESIAELEAAIA